MIQSSVIPDTSVAMQEPSIPEEMRRGHLTFRDFIFKNRTNRRYVYIAAAGAVLQFIVFKYLYPFADFFSDSYSYIYGASANLDINIWPIGYSWFLRYVHAITHSDTAVVAIQYFLLVLSSLVFFFTIGYFYRPAGRSTVIFFVFLFFNPLFLYISNYINSDPLFAALSLLWISQLIWVVHRPMLYQVVTQAVLLYLCFIVRNNAFIYPFIAAAAFFLSDHRRFAKWTGVTLGSLLVLLFINHQRNAAYKIIGKKEFSLFSGWQLANNALYFRDEIELDPRDLPNDRTRQLDSLAVSFYSKVGDRVKPFLRDYEANFFIRERDAPLKQYFKMHYKYRGEEQLIRAWGKASVTFGEYGSYILKHYPVAYVKGFMGINARDYFIPPLEKLKVYNLGKDSVWPEARDWFDYKSTQVTSASKGIQALLLVPFSVVFLFFNLGFIITGGAYLGYRGFRQSSRTFNRSLLILALFLLGNMCFSIFATANVLRYQFFPLLVFMAFVLITEKFVDVNQRAPQTNPENVAGGNTTPQVPVNTL